MLWSSLTDPPISVTCQNYGFLVKIFAKNFQRLKMRNISDVIPMEMHHNHGYLPWDVRHTVLISRQDCARQYLSSICENGYIFNFQISVTPGRRKVRGIVCDENQDGTAMFSLGKRSGMDRPQNAKQADVAMQRM